MKNKILTGSLYTAGILLPQITFAEIQNDKVSPDRHTLFSDTTFVIRKNS